MTFKDIIYTNLLRLLGTIMVDDAAFEAYIAGVAEEKQDDLLANSDKISSLVTDLKQARTLNKIHTDFGALFEVLDILTTGYPDLNIHQLDELRLIPVLIKKLEEAIAGTIDISTEELEITDFVFEPLKKPIQERNFYHDDGTDINESILLVDIKDIKELATWITENQINRDMTAQLLAKIGGDMPLEQKQYVLVHRSLSGKPGAIQSLISLHIVVRGKAIHKPAEYESEISIPITRRILSTNPYQQFNDAISILSEYNYGKDILDKFLRLYHLIENFMYRFPLVALEAKHGNLFYIRDFQIMYEKVSDSELSSLKKLVKEVFAKNYDGTSTFEAFVNEKWAGMLPDISENKLDMLLTVLGIGGEYGKITADKKGFPAVFSKIIYAFRNSLVHNKDTEFHLTHETLLNHSRMDDTAVQFLRKFLMPVLEAISLYLIIENNSIVWLQNATLELWSND